MAAKQNEISSPGRRSTQLISSVCMGVHVFQEVFQFATNINQVFNGISICSKYNKMKKIDKEQ